MPPSADLDTPYSATWVTEVLQTTVASRLPHATWRHDPAAWAALAAWARTTPITVAHGTAPYALGLLTSYDTTTDTERVGQDALLEAILTHWDVAAWRVVDLTDAVTRRMRDPNLPLTPAALLGALLRHVNLIAASSAGGVLRRILVTRPLTPDDLVRLCAVPWNAPSAWREVVATLRAHDWPEPASTRASNSLADATKMDCSPVQRSLLVQVLTDFGAARSGLAFLTGVTDRHFHSAPDGDTFRAVLAVWEALPEAWWADLPDEAWIALLHHASGPLRLLAIQQARVWGTAHAAGQPPAPHADRRPVAAVRTVSPL